MTVAISANIGDFDTPKVHVPQTIDCEFITITEGDGRHPRMAAKEPKLRPWDYNPDGPWIWIDASFEITSPTFVAEALTATTGPIGQWRHPWRSCIYDEAAEVERLTGQKYRGYPARQQAEHYLNVGHPPRWGLWATGLIVYTERLDYLADLWWAELNRWGYQDQISQPVALRNAGLRPVSLPGGLHESPWLRWHNHQRDD